MRITPAEPWPFVALPQKFCRYTAVLVWFLPDPFVVGAAAHTYAKRIIRAKGVRTPSQQCGGL